MRPGFLLFFALTTVLILFSACSQDTITAPTEIAQPVTLDDLGGAKTGPVARAGADVAVTAFTGPQIISPGEVLTLEVTLANVGDLDAVMAFDAWIGVLNHSIELERRTVPTMTAGQTRSGTLQFQIPAQKLAKAFPPGTYTLYLTHDLVDAEPANDYLLLDVELLGNDPFDAIADVVEEYINDNTDCPGVISAFSVFDNLDQFTVIDIRSTSSFEMGHIPGAYNSTMGTILADLQSGAIPDHSPIVIAGYSGQSSSMVKIALELMGYEDVKSLLYGMSSWSPMTSAPWDNAVGDLLPNPETTNNNGNLVTHPYPGLPATTLEDRVQAMLLSGYKGLAYPTIQDNLENYFIVNYWGEADYLGIGTAGSPGHIPGAFQFTPYASISRATMLSNLPVDMPIVVYGWTGHHCAQIVAALNILGYEAYNLNYGANALFYSDLTAHKWIGPNDFPLEVD